MDNPVAEVTTQLFELYSDEIYRYALFVLGSANDAQDTVQEVFTRVFNSWDTFRHDSNPRTWIWSITRNYLSDLKRRKKIPTIALDATLSLKGLPSVHMDTIPEWEDVLKSLSVPYRQVVYWRLIEDLSVSDTAELLGWTHTKVRITLHRAIHCLKTMLPHLSNFHGKDSENHGLQGH